MSSRLIVAHPRDSLASANHKLVDSTVRHLPVVDDDFRIVGMLSDRDVRSVVGDPVSVIERHDRGFAAETCVDAVMTTNPFCVAPDTLVVEIARKLVDDPIGAVVVVSAEDELLGIVSYVDVIAHLIGHVRT